MATAAVSVLLIGIEMVARTRRIHSGLADEMIHAATEQFIPAGVAGLLLTVVLFRFAPQKPVDAARPVADRVQPRPLRVLPLAAAPDVRGRASGTSPPGWPAWLLPTAPHALSP